MIWRDKQAGRDGANALLEAQIIPIWRLPGQGGSADRICGEEPKLHLPEKDAYLKILPLGGLFLREGAGQFPTAGAWFSPKTLDASAPGQ